MRQLVLICPLFLDFLGGGGGWGYNGTFPRPLFSQNTPKNALNNLWTNQELLILAKLWQI